MKTLEKLVIIIFAVNILICVLQLVSHEEQQIEDNSFKHIWDVPIIAEFEEDVEHQVIIILELDSDIEILEHKNETIYMYPDGDLIIRIRVDTLNTLERI